MDLKEVYTRRLNHSRQHAFLRRRTVAVTFACIFVFCVTFVYQRHSSRYGLGETFYTGSPLALSQQTSGANDASTDTSTPSRPAGALPSHEPTRNHFSWSDATRLLVFGDSVTATTFDPTLEQPSQSNPFGNPIFPNNRPNGPTWADYLTLTHNQSQVLTYNFAQGGSTVDNKVQSSLWASPSAVDQTSLFISTYATTGKLDEWDLGTTLAIFRFGVNDCMIEYIFPDHILDVSSDVAQYAKIVEELYSVGLRNFLFLNVGPADVNFNRTGGEVGKLMRLATNIANWNSELAKMKMDLMAKHEGMNALVFDTHSFFLWLEDHPKSVEATQALRNMTGICPQYSGGVHVESGQEGQGADFPECGEPLEYYLWKDHFHPTTRGQNATAAIIVDDCFGAHSGKRFCT